MVKRVPSIGHYVFSCILALSISFGRDFPILQDIASVLSWCWVALLAFSVCLVVILYNVTTGWIRNNQLENFQKYKNSTLTYVTLHTWNWDPSTTFFVWVLPLVLVWCSGNQLQSKMAAIMIAGYLALKLVFKIGYKTGFKK